MKVLVVVPAYREARRLGTLLDAVPSCVVPGAEVRWLIVDDGSGRGEARELASLVASRGLERSVAVMALPVNQGKGAAVSAGFAAGLEQGCDILAFLDADGSAPPSELARALGRLIERPDLSAVIGSRILMLGRRVRRNAWRHYVGRVFATFVSVTFNAPVYDTQCGLKAFRAEALRRHLGKPTDRRWVWDTQLLLSMLSAGEAVEEFPIDWSEAGDSRLRAADPIRMALGLLRFRLSR